MAKIGESSSSSCQTTDAKPVIVRVKRKAFQSPLDAFWLEINERPLKRALLDFENLSITGSAGKVEEFKSKKVLVRHLETAGSTEATIDIVQLFVESDSADATGSKTKGEERKHNLKKENIQDQLLSKARKTQEEVAKNARFEQIWRSRKGAKEVMHGKLHEMCHFYDVVRVDDEERANEKRQQEETLEDHKLMCSYLPLLREFIPSAAEEIESDLQSYKVGKEDYVYDFYTINNEVDMATVDALHPFPLVQVDEEDYCDGPDASEYGSDDSNDENNPLNDYPDEISDGEDEDEEVDSKASDKESGEESASDESTESEHTELKVFREDEELLYEDDYEYEEGDSDDFVDDDDHDVGGYGKD
ncbi:RNA-directed DNA methylation 4 [Cannabis sativa]|uniref:RNA-directed DNA methylation 4 n=1 Tax=Cannabis sativa TaxID=3483 RepID=UPI0011E028C5|nr:RNA-directed DNA methylation 4 [Cannabis sativa]XP_060973086.1 RNA-directed DNA methylation 4 [Cannabis sativa]XP_060973087.1 RNA-directed DNA methylation 4 [Cannabis sativa]XP_060973088.1 RNA-directed DNA methylation 4 [Cannabis sativa]